MSLDADEYPGVPAIQGEIQAACSETAFEDYVGSELQSSDLGLYFLYPISDGWDRGDREYVCIAVPSDGSELSGSVRDSGR